MIRHSARQFLGSSRLRIAVVTGLVVLFWLLMFAAFLDVFLFLYKHFQAISDIVVEYLFAFLFASLLVMMTISDAIIAYASVYRSEETEFLFSFPLRAENTFAYRSADSVVFSLWGIGALVVPMILAYGIVFPTTWYFYPFAVALALVFVLFATELGAFLALVLGAVLPRGRRKALALLGTLVLAAGAAGLLWFRPLQRHVQRNLFSEATVSLIMDRIAFCQHWALPSRWVSGGMLAAARGRLGQATFLGCLLLSNVLFLGLAVHRLAFYAYRWSWQRTQGASARRRTRSDGPLSRALRAGLFFVPFRLRQLVVKDLRTFLRDPSQWSQFLLFFGLLGLYILNLPRFSIERLETYWHSLISLLNLGATCLTLATLTSRFVFPQLSLEGRRIWILGLLPIRRPLVLWGKFLLAAAGTFIISGGLIALSDAMLSLPLWVVAVHLLVVLCVCCGLNGLAVGLGALYPRLGTDNPSKIVSSFGGTLNLICSIGFIALAIAPVVVPLHLHMLGVWSGASVVTGLAVGLGIVVVVSAAATLVPMVLGARAFVRMEF
jgi:ABC-2 type transport system permease protein